MKKTSLIPLLFAAAVTFAAIVMPSSCANTTQAPSGGPKDTIPPVLKMTEPLPGTTNVPVHGTSIYFSFNEYVTLKNANSIFLSPPLSKPPKSKLRGKGVLVTFDEDLAPETTYTLDLGDAIADNNEGNPFAGFVLTFSTGEHIDSMFLTGRVQDCRTLNPIKDATVMLYKDHSDSAIFKHRPDAAVKTDDWGWFCIRNIKDTLYRLYAITDENKNNIFDPETEMVAFCDSAVRPVRKIAPDTYELYKFDMKDTASCDKRKVEYELNIFKGKDSKQALSEKKRTGERSAYITFLSPFVQITRLWFKGVAKKNLFQQFNEDRDSLILWINDQRKQPDTLFLNVEYMKTDTTGKLVKTLETLKLGRDRQAALKAQKSYRKDIKHEDTIAVYKVESAGERFEQYGIRVAFEKPLIYQSFDKINYEITNARQQKSKGKYTWERDSTDIRAYIIRHVGKFLPGFEYSFTLPHRGFRDVDGFYADSTVIKVKLPEDDKLSNLDLVLKGVQGHHYIVDLMTEKRDKVERSFTANKDCTLHFPYLKEGKYCIRITEDKNGNGRVDTGDLLAHKQSEKVRFFKIPGGKTVIPIPPSSEVTQDVDVQAMFE